MLKKWAERRAERAEAKARALQAQEDERRRQLEAVKSFQESIVTIAHAGAVPEVDWLAVTGLDRLPFRFLKSERPLLILVGVEYGENKARRRTVGKTGGASFRVAKGVSIRAGGFSGTPVHYEELVTYGTGCFAITNKHIYFAGERKNVRIPHGKIVSLEQEGDDILRVTRDRVSGLPEFFSVTALWIDCVLDVLGSASEIDFGRGQPDMRAIPETDAIYLLDDGTDFHDA
ncbi:MAG: hypothetical protein F4Z31_22995 [Gemmatimonadetes bacterium]|nr:hypothetical protein [Gemmatimonadota bacterium]MYE92519.1 hypothetical protein [Gemmatimonadota bacterium]MYJ09632.1 hypothetical protein [Gemmatimonadota bacterium]